MTPVLAFGGLLAMLAVPVAVWYHVLADVLTSFTWSFNYFVTELSPWLLMLAAVAFLVPVALSVGRRPRDRLYPRGRRAYIAWGTSLYLLGCILAVELAEIWGRVQGAPGAPARRALAGERQHHRRLVDVVFAARGHDPGPDREELDHVRAPAVAALHDPGAHDALGLELVGLGLHPLHRQLARLVERLRVSWASRRCARSA